MPDTPTTFQKVAAEILGTFVLVFFGCGAAVLSGLTSGEPSGYVVTGLSFGLTVVVMAYAVGRISGGHFNPAVTLGAALGGRLPWSHTVYYWLSQLIGGVLAALALYLVLSGFDGFDVKVDGLAQNAFGDAGSGISWSGAFLIETICTAVFLYVILSVTDARNEHPALAPLAIGLTLAMIHFASIGATGTSVNPARSIGPALFVGGDALEQLWLFIAAPLLGAAIAGLTYRPIFGDSEAVATSDVPGYGAPDSLQEEWNDES